jgi:hypothetical protein
LDPGSGRAQPGAWVSIYLANTLTLATLWADDDVSTLANPVQANQLGQVAMRVNPGVYDVSMSWDGAQPTIVEDVLAWTPEAAVLTTPGDLLVGSSAGGTARLPLGAENMMLVVDQGMPAWKYLAMNDGIPPGPSGSLLVIATDNYVRLIPPGTQDQALAMAGGTPTWVSSLLPPGTTLPINQPGDLVVGQVGTGLPTRLAAGTEGQVLSVVAPGSVNWVGPGLLSRGDGQGQLVFDWGGGVLQLQPQFGNQLWIGTASRTIPGAGPTLAPTGLAIGALYYIYAAWVSNTMVLEASPTAWSYDAGYIHKIGDPSRAFVGLAQPVDGGGGVPVWRDDDTYRYVLSIFRPLLKEGKAYLSAPRTTTSETAIELHPEMRCHFLSWGGRAVILGIQGTAYTNVNAKGFHTWVWLDNASVSGTYVFAPYASVHTNIHTSITKAVTEGAHTVTMWVKVDSGGSTTWFGQTPGGGEGCKTYFMVSG